MPLQYNFPLADTESEQHDVDKLMQSARKKLEEFVRLNPHRAKNGTEMVEPSLDFANGSIPNFTLSSVSSSFFPGSVSSSVHSSVPFVTRKVTDHVMDYKEDHHYPINTQSTTVPFPCSRFGNSFTENESPCPKLEDQPCCSYQAPTNHYPTSILKRPRKEPYSVQLLDETYGEFIAYFG